MRVSRCSDSSNTYLNAVGEITLQIPSVQRSPSSRGVLARAKFMTLTSRDPVWGEWLLILAVNIADRVHLRVDRALRLREEQAGVVQAAALQLHGGLGDVQGHLGRADSVLTSVRLGPPSPDRRGPNQTNVQALP